MTNTASKNLNTSSVTRESMLGAMSLYDTLGAEAFHAKFSTSERGCKNWIVHDGRRYPSKAIVAAAAGASTSKFSGGKARLGAMLSRLGFSLGALVFVSTAPGVVASAANAQAEDDAEAATLALGTLETTYFASGTNRPAQIRGFGAIRQAVGFTAPELSENGEDAVYALGVAGVRVFGDTGAFGEVEFGEDGPEVVRPIDEARWQRTLDLFARIAAVLGPRFYPVAPDCVGFQDETLARLTRWREEVRGLISAGARVIVVAQKGPVPQAAFDAQVEELLGTSDYVRGLPCNKGATTPEEVREFCAARKPARLHLLGIGLRNPKLRQYAAAVGEASPDTELSLDSCLICESSGASNGRASHPKEALGGPRVFTWAKQAARRLIAQGRTLVRDVEDLAIRLAWGDGQVSLC